MASDRLRIKLEICIPFQDSVDNKQYCSRRMNKKLILFSCSWYIMITIGINVGWDTLSRSKLLEVHTHSFQLIPTTIWCPLFPYAPRYYTYLPNVLQNSSHSSFYMTSLTINVEDMLIFSSQSALISYFIISHMFSLWINTFFPYVWYTYEEDFIDRTRWN